MRTDILMKYLELNGIIYNSLVSGLNVRNLKTFPYSPVSDPSCGHVQATGEELVSLVSMANKPLYDTSVFIGRFQPIHVEHLKTIRKGLKLSSRVVIVIGSAFRPRDPRNPWTHQEREEMIRASFSEEENKRLSFLPVSDLYYNLPLWFTNVQAGVKGFVGDLGSVALLGYEKDSSSFYLKGFPQWDFIPCFSTPTSTINATEIRDRLFCDSGIKTEVLLEMCPLEKATKDYLEKWVQEKKLAFNSLTKEWLFLKAYKEKWASAPYQPTFVTADSVVIRSGHVLMVRRGFNPGKGLLALPGGYLNPREDFLEAAIRELKEETAIQIPREVLEKSARCTRVFAHPDRDLRGRTITHASLFDLGFGPLPRVKGKDDAIDALWIPISEVHTLVEEIFSDHYAILTNLIYSF